MASTRWPVVVGLLVIALALACAPPRSQAKPCNDDSECGPAEGCRDGSCTGIREAPWQRPDAGPEQDAGPGRDAAEPSGDDDGGAPDASLPADDDAGAPDAGGADAGDAFDAGPLDAGAPDAGLPVDAGFDAGVPLDDDDVLPTISGLAGYSVVYRMQIPTSGARFNYTNPPYAFDGSAALDAAFTRVGYYLELQAQDGELYYVYVEADALSSDVAQIGVPTRKSGALFQRDLANTRVESNHPGVTTGRGQALNVEFWPSDYGPLNDAVASSPASADDLVHDFGDGDATTSAGHGSMQIHNHAEGRTLFAFNDWGGDHPGEALEIGMGNQPTGEPDWTHADNAAGYALKTLTVVVNATPTFPAMPPNLPGPPAEIASRVSAEELAGYRLVYALDIPEAAAFNGSGGVPYSVDNAAFIPAGSFDRVAYFLELEDLNGAVQWVWISVAAFTLDAARVGVPARATGVHLQHVLDDGRVFSNTVPEGSSLTTLNIEFWSTNYEATNGLPLAGASDGAYDFGDRPTEGGYGSMQIHDSAVGQTLFAYNRWGSSTTPSDLGIGDSPSGNPDWTFRGNSLDYVTRRLTVLVRARPAPL